MISRRSFLKTTTAALYIPATRAKAEASISSLNQLLDSFAQEYLDTSPMLVS